MDFSEIKAMALSIREAYSRVELEKYGQRWGAQDLMLGFVGDVGDLAKLAIAQERRRDIPDFEEKTAHELADCLWSIIVLADKYDIDLEESFSDLCAGLHQRIGAG